MTHFDRASLDRLLPASSGAPDWDDVMSRSAALQSHRRRRLGMIAAAALVAVVGAASAIGGVRVLLLDKGFIGLPPVGATPSAPESGELVLHWAGSSTTHARTPWRWGYRAPFVDARLYADGRMIWWRDAQVPEGANEAMSGYLEQRLTPEGVELLRSEVAGLLDRSRALLETVPADHDPWLQFGGSALVVPGHGSRHGSVEVRDGDRFVRLQWGGDDILDNPRPNALKGTIATPEQLSALRRIDALLTDPASVLPSSAWAERKVRAYVPSHYAVCIGSSSPKDASQLLSLLPTQAADVLRDKGRTRLFDAYCSKLTTEEAREVANAVSGLPRHAWPFTLMYVIADADSNSNPTTIEFDPYFPDGRFLLHGGGR